MITRCGSALRITRFDFDSSRGVYIVAWFEAAKGGLVLLVGFGLLALVHQDIQAMAEQLVRRFHLNPANHYPQIFIHALSAAADAGFGSSLVRR